jgi:hypothetical protein
MYNSLLRALLWAARLKADYGAYVEDQAARTARLGLQPE